MKQLLLWRGNHFDGKLGAWTPCYGFKPVSRFGGNEYIEYVPRSELDMANQAIERMQLEMSDMFAELEALRAHVNLEA